MSFNVRVFINGEEIKASDLPNYQIESKAVDRIVNDVFDRVNGERQVGRIAS
jgi:hypothetical protein